MDGKMNKDVKIGLSIGLLALIAIFCLVVLPTHNGAPKTDTTSTDQTDTAAITPEETATGVTPDLPAAPAAPASETGATAAMSGHPEVAGNTTAPGYVADTTSTTTPVAPGVAGLTTGSTTPAVTGTTDGTTTSFSVPATVVAPKTYTVKKGDSLATIARSEYGNAKFWTRIKEANPGVNERSLKVGKQLVIPPLPETTVAPTGATVTTAGRTHTVAAGETLSDISKQDDGTTANYKKIMVANHITDAKSVRVGKVLTIPDLATTMSSTSGVSVTPASDNGQTFHVVAAGETLGDIARQYYGNASAYKRIMQANGITDATRVTVGRRLVIPPKATTTGATVTTTTTTPVTTAATTTDGIVRVGGTTADPGTTPDRSVMGETRSAD